MFFPPQNSKSGSPSNQNTAPQPIDPCIMAAKIKAVNERATLFRITSNAMVNVSGQLASLCACVSVCMRVRAHICVYVLVCVCMCMCECLSVCV